MARSEEELTTLARAGDPRAQFAMAQRCDAQGRHDLALGWLHNAAESGDARSGTFLGARLLTGYAAPKRPEDAARVLLKAAGDGGPEACELVAVLHATGRFLAPDWTAALDWLARAAELGEPRSQRQLRLLARSPHDASDWASLRRAIDLDALFASPQLRALSDAPRIATIDDFLTPDECAWLIERARGKVAPAQIYDDGSGHGLLSGKRSNGAAEFHLIESDVVMAMVRERIRRACGIAPLAMEDTSVLHYLPGQEFVRHFDFLDPAQGAYAQVIAERGQRVATFLIYLNDDFEGAETDFPVIGLRYKAPRGGALMFWNVEEDGQPDRRTVHAGTTPTRGQKWLLSIFLRDREQPYA